MQKTAYELRISDCSSDVCSSDLLEDELALLLGRHQRGFVGLAFGDVDRDPGKALRLAVAAEGASTAGMNPAPGATLDTDAIFDRIFAAGREDPADLRAHTIETIGRATGRDRVCQKVEI